MDLVVRGAVLASAACLSAFFSASETALFSLPWEEVRGMVGARGSRGAIADLLARPKRLLTTVLFGNMVVNVVFFSVSFLLIVRYGGRLGPGAKAALGIGSLLFVIAFCELLPKNIAVSFAHPVSRMAAVPLTVFQRVCSPFIFALEKITDRMSVLLGRHLHPEPFIRAEELGMLINLSEREGVLDADLSGMIAAVVKLSQTTLREVMVPRVEIVCFNIADPPDSLRRLFQDSKHTLIPVYEDRVDNMLGVIHAKDFLFHPEGADLRKIVSPIPFFPETATVEHVLRQLRERHTRMGFVVDEYGGVEGLITVEDILEEIVGEITDEFDVEQAPAVERIGERRFRLRGDLSVREWHEAFEMQMPELPVDTIGGLVMILLDRIPAVGDRVRYRNLELTVEKTHGPRVRSVILELANGEGQQGA